MAEVKTEAERASLDFCQTHDGKTVAVGPVYLKTRFDVLSFFLPSGSLVPGVQSICVNHDGTGFVDFEFANADVMYKFVGWVPNFPGTVLARLVHASYHEDKGVDNETMPED